jgi:type II secretory pathway component GspD/PulD (secretin)
MMGLKMKWMPVCVAAALQLAVHGAWAEPVRASAQPASSTALPAPVATPDASAEDAASQADNRFVARDRSVDALFRALTSRMGRSVVLSKKAAAYKVSGTFDMSRPFDVLQQVSNDLGLLWYYDGRIIYVTDPSETRSEVVPLENISVGALTRYLRKAGLYDERYAVRGEPDGHALYVSGPPKYVEIVASTAALLDRGTRRQMQGDQTRRIEAIRLKHAFVGDRVYSRRNSSIVMPGIASVLRDILQDTRIPASVAIRASSPGGKDAAAATNESVAAAPPPLPSPFPEASAPERRADERIGVVAYPDTNSLVVSATGADLEMIRNLVSTLDVPREQIELSLSIIDLSKSDLDEIGARWSGQARIGDNFSLSLNAGASLGGTATSNFMAAITALSRAGKAQIVTRPVVVTQENVPALFDNSKTFYVRLVGERQVDMDEVTYGTLISVTPKLDSSQGRVEMTLDIEDGSSVNDEHGESTVAGLPIVGRTTISTVARVEHGQSLLIGGYTREQIADTVEKIPVLGSLPLVGGAFRYRNSNNSKLVRVFLIEPRVLEEGGSTDMTDRGRIPANVSTAVDRLKEDLKWK